MRLPRARTVGGAAAVAVLAAVITVGILRAGGQPGAPLLIRDGPPAPELRGTDPVTGESVTSADFAGRPLVINMWASWCTGCRAEAADIRRFTEDHPGVGFLGIDVSDSRGGARAFVEEFGWTHPSIFDPGGELAARLGLRGLPTTIFVRADGTIAAEALGEVDYAQLAGTVAEMEGG